MRAINILVCLAFCLVGFVNGSYNDEVFKYHSKGLVQVWVGRTAVNVGDVTGQKLYSKMLKGIHDNCRDNDSKKCTIDWTYVPTQFAYWDDSYRHNWGVRDTSFSWHVEAEWDNTMIRGLMITTIAHILANLSSANANCYSVGAANNKKLCNVGDFIRINLPAGQHHNNYMQLSLRSPHRDVSNQFYCCPTRHLVDARLDDNSEEFARLLGKDFSREVRC